ncbi:MAG: PAS domain S-box protein [Chloroflexota bacterium]
MAISLRVLILEDNPADANLILDQLRRDGFEVVWQRVESGEDYADALTPDLDVVLADYSLPRFDALAALQLLQDRQPDLPLIIVSGSISEEVAVDCMKRGAADYILKDRLARLGQAVRHALEARQARVEQRRAEAALREYEANFRLLAERAHDVIFRYRLRPTPVLDFISPSVTRTTGFTPEELYADCRRAWRILHGEDRTAFRRFVASGDLPQPMTVRIKHRNGSIGWLELSAVALRDDSGELEGAEGIARDVTERICSEQALRESEEKYRTLVEAIDDPVMVKDAAGRYIVVNDAAARMHGRAKEEFIGKVAADVFEPEDARVAMANDRRVVADGIAIENDTYNLKREDGRVYHRRKSPLRDAAGQVVGIVSVSRDITARKRAEEALRESEERYRKLVELSPDAILLHDGEHIQLINPVGARALGYASTEDLIGRPVRSIVHPEYIAVAEARWRSLLSQAGSVPLRGFKYLCADGSALEVETAESALTCGGRPALIGVFRDVTDRLRAERATRETEARYRTFVEHSEDGMLLTDEQGFVVEWNLALGRISGLGRAEALGKPIWDVHPQLVPTISATQTGSGLIKEKVLRFLQGEQLGPIGGMAQGDIRRKDGSIRTVQPLVFALETDRGRVLAATVRDVTELKRAEEARALLAAIVEGSQDAIAGQTPEGVITSWNSAAERLYGYTAAEAVGQSVSLIAPSECRDEVTEAYERIRRGEPTSTCDTIRRRKDGRLVHVSASMSPILDDHGRVIGVSGIAHDITHRLLAETALRHSEEKYRSLFETANDAVFVVDGSGRYVDANPQALAFTGYSHDELLHMSVQELLFQEPRALAEGGRLFAELRRRGAVQGEVLLKHKDGQCLDAELSAALVSPDRYQAIARDVRGRKQMEATLKQSEERFRALFDRSLDGVYVHDFVGNFLDLNDAAREMLGYTREEIPGLTFSALVAADQRLLFARTMAELIKTGTQREATAFRLKRADGSEVWVETKSSVIFHDDEPYAVQGIARDITERKSADAALIESESRFRSSFDDAAISMSWNALDGRFLRVNRPLTELLGYSESELLARDFQSVTHQEDMAGYLEHTERMLAGQQSVYQIEERYIHKAGNCVWVRLHVSLVRDAVGQPQYFVAQMEDITERRQAVESLLLSEARFRAIFERSAIGITLSDMEGHIVEANPSYLQMIGYTADELLRTTLRDRVYADDLPVVVMLFDQIVAEELEYSQRVTRNVRKDGQVIWVNVITSLMTSAQGEPRYVLGLIEDISARREIEGQLQRAQQLEVAGRIAAQVAHDFNNLLVPVVGLPELIKLRLPQGDPAVAMCDVMLEAARSMAEINDNMLTMGRRGYVEQQPTDLNAVVKQVIAHMPSVPATLGVRLDLAPGLLPVNGAQAQLFRVVTNLLANARDAMEEVGVLSVATANCYLDSGQFGRYGQIDVGEYTKLTVSDTGSGIPDDVRDKIFDAFFTTKRTDAIRGSGLGLTVVQSIVNDHHGYIDLETEVGRGSTFVIYLPVSRGQTQNGPEAGQLGGSERILVVDDDRFQRLVATQILQVLGYQVATVNSGEQAVTYLRKHPADLVLLDMVMPGGMDGAESFRRILEVRPGQKVIIVSGYAETELVREALRLGAGAFHQKPLSMDRLARAVRAELARTV